MPCRPGTTIRPIPIPSASIRRPTKGALMLGWKRRPDGNGHEGIDFAAEVGDRVRLEISPYDVTRGRINYRHKDERAPVFNPQRKPIYKKR